MQSSKLRKTAMGCVALAAVTLCMPAMAAKSDYKLENVANPTCNKRCLMEHLDLILSAIGNNTPTGLPIAIVVAVLALIVLWNYRASFAGLVKP